MPTAASPPLHLREIDTPLGEMIAVASEEALVLLEFGDRRALATQLATASRRFHREIAPGNAPVLDQLARELAEYFAVKRRQFDVRLETPGTPFQERVWAELLKVPHGKTRSYLDLAKAIGDPAATRAVAKANGDNRIAILIPCHRIIGSDGSLTGYGGKLWRKQALLELEGAIQPSLLREQFSPISAV